MNYSDRARKYPFSEFEGDEQPAANFINHGCLGQNRNTDPDLNRPFDRFDIVELHDVINRSIILLEDAVDRFARRDIAFEGDEILPRQMLEAHATAVCQRMFRAANKYQFIMSQRDNR